MTNPARNMRRTRDLADRKVPLLQILFLDWRGRPGARGEDVRKVELHFQGEPALRLTRREIAMLESVRFQLPEHVMNLEPCPFCGTRETVLQAEWRNPDRFSTGSGKVVYVECLRCGTRGPYHIWKRGASEAWNRRALSGDAALPTANATREPRLMTPRDEQPHQHPKAGRGDR